MSSSNSAYDTNTDYDDHVNKILTWYIVGYVVGGLLALAFWIAVIYFVVKACKTAAERPRTINVHQHPGQPQIHYVIQQEPQIGPDGRPYVIVGQPQIGPDGRPVVYVQQPGQNVQYVYYQQSTPAAGAHNAVPPPPSAQQQPPMQQQQGGSASKTPSQHVV